MIEVAEVVENELLNREGTINVTTDIQNMDYEYVVDINTDLAATYGLTQYEIQKQLNLFLYGGIPARANFANKYYNIYLKGNVKDISDLENLAIKSNLTGEKVLLKQVANIELEKSLPAIKRLDREQAVTVECNVISGYSPIELQNSIINDTLPNLNTQGLNIKYYGQKQTIDTYLKGLDRAAVFALSIIYIILFAEVID